MVILKVKKAIITFWNIEKRLTVTKFNSKQVLIKMDKDCIFILEGDVAQMVERVTTAYTRNEDRYLASPLILLIFL